MTSREQSDEPGYDPIAEYYDLFLGRPYAENLFPGILRLMRKFVTDSDHVLDLCCGAGHIAGLLTGAGYRVDAVDNSPTMIGRARSNAPAADCWIGDARALGVENRYDVALSTYNSLNHMMTGEELSRAFRSVHAALRDRGHFFFDLLTPEGMAANWTNPYTFVGERHLWTTRMEFNAENAVGRAELTAFWQATDDPDCWRRADTILRNRGFSTEEVLARLRDCSFARYECHTGAELGWDASQSGRVLYHAWKR